MRKILEHIRQIDFRREARALTRDYLLVILGTLLVGAAFTLFFEPHNIAPGGVTGLATILAQMLPLSIGTLSFLINVPLFLMGARNVGWRFALRSFIAMTLLSLFIDLLPVIDVGGDMMLASIFGGALMGVGLGIVVRAGATTGGTDMAAQLLHRLMPFLSVAVILLGIDGLVVMIAAAAFGIKAGLWALIAVFISSKAMDFVIQGFGTAMQFMIITSKPEEIAHRINYELDRGCTRLHAQGTYTGNDVGLLMCICSRLEAPRLKKMVSESDPRAFVTVSDVHEALGEGFAKIEEK